MLVNETGSSAVRDLAAGAYRLFEKGDFINARSLFDQAHARNFEDIEIRTGLRACGFWELRIRELESISHLGSRGDYLRRQWLVFEREYAAGFEHPFSEGRSKIRLWVHGEALECYEKQAFDTQDPECMFQAARCLKALGRFEDAIRSIERALKSVGRVEARLIADLADAYAFIGETRSAKVLMREAMFLDASAVELDELNAPMFRRLVERLESDIPSERPDFVYWLPVYGALWGVLDVNRELKPVEYGKLKQMIHAMKSEIADGDEDGTLTPRLINAYLRLIDHYQSTGADRGASEEALMNIKLLNPVIYERYL